MRPTDTHAPPGRAAAGDEYLTPRDFEARYGVPVRTQERWRVSGDAPPFVRIGPRRIAYRLSDCEAWAASRTYANRAAELVRRAAAG